MASKRRNLFHKNKKQETTEIEIGGDVCWWGGVDGRGGGPTAATPVQCCAALDGGWSSRVGRAVIVRLHQRLHRDILVCRESLAGRAFPQPAYFRQPDTFFITSRAESTSPASCSYRTCFGAYLQLE
ncbi:hypothetical protein AAG570_000492 [Ranatra chinensis]|uniref:Uncharacterized protein n=1 Tax=Ranatra chinensis TaxID=642074 RepID=A0ABD0Z7L8_9HEMI